MYRLNQICYAVGSFTFFL